MGIEYCSHCGDGTDLDWDSNDMVYVNELPLCISCAESKKVEEYDDE